jgi:hypothetical protein
MIVRTIHNAMDRIIPADEGNRFSPDWTGIGNSTSPRFGWLLTKNGLVETQRLGKPSGACLK